MVRELVDVRGVCEEGMERLRSDHVESLCWNAGCVLACIANGEEDLNAPLEVMLRAMKPPEEGDGRGNAAVRFLDQVQTRWNRYNLILEGLLGASSDCTLVHMREAVLKGLNEGEWAEERQSWLELCGKALFLIAKDAFADIEEGSAEMVPQIAERTAAMVTDPVDWGALRRSRVLLTMVVQHCLGSGDLPDHISSPSMRYFMIALSFVTTLSRTATPQEVDAHFRTAFALLMNDDGSDLHHVITSRAKALCTSYVRPIHYYFDPEEDAETGAALAYASRLPASNRIS